MPWSAAPKVDVLSWAWQWGQGFELWLENRNVDVVILRKRKHLGLTAVRIEGPVEEIEALVSE